MSPAGIGASDFGVAATGVDFRGKDWAGAARDAFLMPADATADTAIVAAPASAARRLIGEVVVDDDGTASRPPAQSCGVQWGRMTPPENGAHCPAVGSRRRPWVSRPRA